MTAEDEGAVPFGFREVPANEKGPMVRDIFRSVAPRYDLMNDLMSAGVHRLWKQALIARLDPKPGETLLDVAGGTGDIALGFLKRADLRSGAEARAIICDINEEMLGAGRARRTNRAYRERFELVCADAEALPVADKSVDAYAIAFGIRNVTRMERALGEARRILKIGGRFACLEFSHPVTDSLQKLYDAYSFNVIPWLGGMVTGDRDSYRYLVESIRRFPNQEMFASMIASAGFARVSYANMTGGVVALHTGWRI